MLRATRGVNNLALDQVVQAFLQRTKTIDFVCVVDIVKSLQYGNSDPSRFEVRGWTKRQETAHLVSDTLVQAFGALPSPVDNAINTLGHFKFAGTLPRRFGRYKGGVSMSARSVEFSLRAVMDYLAGSIDRAEFERIVPSDWLEYLRKRLDAGSSISNLFINRNADSDDDGLVIEFGGHDAARVPFREPSNNKT
jgi:hypothetical protein